MAGIPLIAAEGAAAEDGAAEDAEAEVLKQGTVVMLYKAPKLRAVKGWSAPSLWRRILQVMRSASRWLSMLRPRLVPPLKLIL
jgi:hypothetical protein